MGTSMHICAKNGQKTKNITQLKRNNKNAIKNIINIQLKILFN